MSETLLNSYSDSKGKQPKINESKPSTPMESTLVIIKPDATALGQEHEIINAYRRAGLTVCRHRWIGRANKLVLQIHYTEHEGTPYYQGLIDFMSSGRIVVLELSGPTAISRVRTLNGPTDPRKATSDQQDTIRVKFGGKSVPQNAVHASDSPISAQNELRLWFESGLVLDEEPNAWPRP